MAEQEIIKSARRIYKTTRSKQKSFWHRAREICIEVAIIVFAVTLSISLHSWNEKRHHREEAHLFLKGLKNDLKNDIEEMKSDKSAFKGQSALFKYISSLQSGETANSDSLKKHQRFLFAIVSFNKNSARYEGFKYSGKLSYIENENLQNNILDLYVSDIPSLMSSTDTYNTQKYKFVDYITANTVDYPKGNFYTAIASEPNKNLSKIFLSNIIEVLEDYTKCIQKMEDIIREIDKNNLE